MAQQKKRNRREQRAARALAAKEGIPYTRALARIREKRAADRALRGAAGGLLIVDDPASE